MSFSNCHPVDPFFKDPKSIYVLQCIGFVNIARGSDLVTNTLQDDWTGKRIFMFSVNEQA